MRRTQGTEFQARLRQVSEADELGFLAAAPEIVLFKRNLESFGGLLPLTIDKIEFRQECLEPSFGPWIGLSLERLLQVLDLLAQGLASAFLG